MLCSNPFPLSSSDAQQFTADVGEYFDQLPPWGGMFAWKGRLILAFEKPDSTMVFSDVSGGIPWAQAQGGCIPAAAFLASLNHGEYISPTEAFFMSLVPNFMQVAKERFDQMIAAEKYIVDAATGDILDPLVKPVTDILWPLAIVAAVVLAVIYLPKR